MEASMIPIGDDPPRRGWPWVMNLILLANIGVFLYQLSLGREMAPWIESMGLIPVEILSGRDIPPPDPGPVGITFLTSLFVHGSFFHIASNMLYLWVFGDNVEDALGHAGFAVFYLVCGIVAGITHVLMNMDSTLPSVGASGAIAGVLGAYLCWFPSARVRTLILFFPFITVTRIAAVLVIGLWFITQLLSGLASLEVETYQASGIAVWAHVGGFVCGVVIALLNRPRLFRGRRSA